MRYLLATLIVAAFSATAARAFDHDHKIWDGLLKTYAKRGRVNYKLLKARDAAKLKAYLDQLGTVGKNEVGKWSNGQQLAFWINAYNAFTVKAILDNYPIRPKGIARFRFPANSIRQIPGVWDKLKFKAAGENVTLSQIEHTKLRAELKEPRIHFAVVCASIGCPDLLGKAYTAANVDKQLEDDAIRFVRNSAKVRVDVRGKKLMLSQIFKWFGEDFKNYKSVAGYGKHRGIVSFVYKYSTPAARNAIKANKLKVDWLDYDWSLNTQ